MKVSKRVRQWEKIWEVLGREKLTVHELSQKLKINSHIISRFLRVLEQLKLVKSVRAEYTYNKEKRIHRKVKWYHKIKKRPFSEVMSLIQSRPKPYTMGFREMDNKVWRNRYWRD